MHPQRRRAPAPKESAEALQAKLDAQAEANEKAQLRLKEQLCQMQQNRKLQAVAGRKIRKKEMTTQERQWSMQIQDGVKRFFWNKKKFCNTEERLDDATKMIAMGMEIDELDGRQSPQEGIGQLDSAQP